MLRDSCLIKELKSVDDANQTCEWGSGKEADSIRTLTSQEMVVSVQNVLKGHNLEEGVWVFGYGSLMWNPDFKVAEKISGTISGYHRRLCLKSIVGTDLIDKLFIGILEILKGFHFQRVDRIVPLAFTILFILIIC